MRYKSYARTTKTYHGVTFEPGDEKDVNGYINDSRFVRIKDKPKQKKQTTNDIPQSVKRENKKVSQDNDVEVQSTSKGVQKDNKSDNKQPKQSEVQTDKTNIKTEDNKEVEEKKE